MTKSTGVFSSLLVDEVTAEFGVPGTSFLLVLSSTENLRGLQRGDRTRPINFVRRLNNIYPNNFQHYSSNDSRLSFSIVDPGLDLVDAVEEARPIEPNDLATESKLDDPCTIWKLHRDSICFHRCILSLNSCVTSFKLVLASTIALSTSSTTLLLAATKA